MKNCYLYTCINKRELDFKQTFLKFPRPFRLLYTLKGQHQGASPVPPPPPTVGPDEGSGVIRPFKSYWAEVFTEARNIHIFFTKMRDIWYKIQNSSVYITNLPRNQIWTNSSRISLFVKNDWFFAFFKIKKITLNIYGTKVQGDP